MLNKEIISDGKIFSKLNLYGHSILYKICLVVCI